DLKGGLTPFGTLRSVISNEQSADFSHKTPYGSPKIATFGGVNAINPSDVILGNLLSQTLRYCAENDFFDSLKGCVKKLVFYTSFR
ncbi:MAG: hypothetical protein IKU60_01135, partial [Clostridia bacterium]|nr:hypothetical protein [Clostridia bacterium]